MTLPFPSFVDRPLAYFLWYLLVILLLCLWPFNFLQMNQVAWEPGGGLRFTPPSTAYTSAAPSKLTGLHEWTLFMDVKTLAPWKQGRILGYSLDERRYNLNLDQISDDLVLRLRTTVNQRPREMHVDKLFEPNVERRFRFAIVYDGSDLSLYVDGERRARERIGTIDYSAWGSQYPLILGSHANGTFGWRGIFYGLAVFPHRMAWFLSIGGQSDLFR